MKRAGVVIILRRTLEVQPLVLAVTNRAFGGISLPGGKTKYGEDSRRAAIREVHEETGVILLSHDVSRIVEAVNVVKVRCPAGACIGSGCVSCAGTNVVDEECMVSVFHARYMFGEPRDIEDGTRHSWVPWFALLDGSPFHAFYARHFPDGILHMRATQREMMPAPRPT